MLSIVVFSTVPIAHPPWVPDLLSEQAQRNRDGPESSTPTSMFPVSLPSWSLLTPAAEGNKERQWWEVGTSAKSSDNHHDWTQVRHVYCSLLKAHIHAHMHIFMPKASI